MSRPAWFPDWSGRTAVVLASGPSARDAPIELAQGRAAVIATNESWRLAPWADALYACDGEWWATGAGDGFRGLKVSRSEWPGVKKISLIGSEGSWSNAVEFDRLGYIGAGAGSGFQAMNLAIQFGARRIALVGFDARVDLGVHWHGCHGNGLKNPFSHTAALWVRFMDEAAPDIARRRIEVVNCSPVSAISAFPFVDLADALEIADAA